MASISELDIVTYKIPSYSGQSPDDYVQWLSNNINKTQKGGSIMAKIQTIRDKLEAEKPRMDNYPLDLILQVLRQEDPFVKAKYDLKNKFGIKYITNAWIKCYEIIKYYGMMDSMKNNKYFDNASFPGAFILATSYYNQMIPKSKPLDWYAASLISQEEHLDDQYCIYENNSQRWLMGGRQTGDVADPKFQKHLHKSISGVELYSSDISGSHEGRYATEEEDNIPLHIGQVICCLLILKKGGNAFFKTFTYSQALSINVIEVLSMLFKEVYLSKPATSRAVNSETYIVCKGYLTLKDENLKILVNLLRGNHQLHNYPESNKFISAVYKSCDIHVSQTKLLKNVMDKFEKLYNIKQDIDGIKSEMNESGHKRYIKKSSKISYDAYIDKCQKLIDTNERNYEKLSSKYKNESNRRRYMIYSRWFRWADLKRLDNPYPNIKVGCNK